MMMRLGPLLGMVPLLILFAARPRHVSSARLMQISPEWTPSQPQAPAPALSLVDACDCGSIPAHVDWQGLFARCPGEEDREIVRRLQATRVDLHLDNVPLLAAVDLVRETTGFNLLIEESFLNRPNDTVSVHADNRPAGDVLLTMLQPFDLDFAVYADMVVIASEQRLHTRLRLDLYDVTDLVADSIPDNDFVSIALPVNPCTMMGDDLAAVVRDVVRGDWSEEAGKTCECQHGLLIVRNAIAVHAEVARFLDILHDSVNTGSHVWPTYARSLRAATRRDP